MGPVKMGHFELWELRSWPQFVFCLFRPCPTMPLSRSLIEPQPHNWMCSGRKTKSIWKFGLDCDDLVSVTQKMAWSLGRIILHTPHSNHPFLKPFFSLRESINRVKKSYNRRAPPPFYWKCPIFSFLFITPLSKIHLNFCQGDIVWISENNNPWTAHTRITLLNNLHYSQKNHCNDNCTDFSDYNDIIATLDKLIMSFILRGAGVQFTL